MSNTGWVVGGKGEPTNIDPLLAPLLPPGSDDHAGQSLSHLIATHARPVIESVIRFKLHLPLHRTTGQADADDLREEAVVQLLTKLQKFREEPAGHPIVDVRGLAAVIAHRTCSRWMRRQFPKRHALKNRLHYLLTRGDGFALWQGENKKLIAGYAAWKGRKNLATRVAYCTL